MIHWRSSARSRQLLVREFEDQAQRRATLLVDNAIRGTADEASHDALERAISLAASLASTYIRDGYAVRLIARGQSIAPACGPHQLATILRMLALLPTVADTIPFAGHVDPRSENLLIIPCGTADVMGRPSKVEHVLEAD